MTDKKSETKRKIILKKLSSHNTIWHPDSTLVFKSQKEKIVVGRFVDEEVVSLDQECIELCESWGFKYDESLLETEEESGECVEEPVEDDHEASHEEEVETQEEDGPSEVPDQVPSENVVPSSTVPQDSPKVSQHDQVKRETQTSESLRESLANLNREVFLVHDNLVQENESLQDKLTCTENKLAELQQEYDVIKKKFDTMKSLFA